MAHRKQGTLAGAHQSLVIQERFWGRACGREWKCTRSEKKEGTHSGCCGWEVADCGSQHHPNTLHQALPKERFSSHLCLLFHPWNHPLKEGKMVVVVESRDSQDSDWRVKKGCFGKEEEPHSSLLCLFVLLLVVHWLMFLMPLLSVSGASLQMGNTMVVMHHSTIVNSVCCGLRDKRVETTLKTILKRVTAVLCFLLKQSISHFHKVCV